MRLVGGLHFYLYLQHDPYQGWLVRKLPLTCVYFCFQHGWNIPIDVCVLLQGAWSITLVIQNWWIHSALDGIPLIFYLEFSEGDSAVFWGTLLHFLWDQACIFYPDLHGGLHSCFRVDPYPATLSLLRLIYFFWSAASVMICGEISFFSTWFGLRNFGRLGLEPKRDYSTKDSGCSWNQRI